MSEIYNMGDISSQTSWAKGIFDLFNKILWIIAVIWIMWKGIQFIQSAPEGKAKIKEELLTILIGLLLLTSIFNIIMAVKAITVDLGLQSTEATVDTGIAKGLGIAQIACFTMAVVLIMWMGITWLITAPEGKAQIKKGLIILLIGIILLVSAGTIIGIVAGVGQGTFGSFNS